MDVNGVKKARGSTIGLFLVLSALILAGYLAAYRVGFVQADPDSIEASVYRLLSLNALLIVGPVVGVLLGYEKLSLQDIGIVWKKLPFAMLFGAGLWLLVQGIEVVGGLLLHGHVEIDPAWSGRGLAIISLLVAHLLGTALYEETAFRGFLLRQCFLNSPRWTRNRKVVSATVAILVSQLAFALFHVPWKVTTQGWSANILGELSGVMVTGVVYALLYLRTDNLFLVMGIHALGNAPTPLITPVIGTANLLLLFTVLIWILWPWMRKWEEKKGEKNDNSQSNRQGSIGASQNNSRCPSQGSRPAVLHR